MEFIKKINIGVTLFVILALRSLFAYDYSQAIAFACVTAVYCYHLHLQSKKVKDLDKEVTEELEKMKAVITGLSMKNAIRNPAINPEKKSYF
jgi:DNA-binding Lrp family transcriptional regulator